MLKPAYYFSLDERRDIVVPGTYEETLSFCIEHFLTTAQNAIKDHDKFFVALSGGSTPKAIYEGLSSATYRGKINWKKVYLFWSDERNVPPNHQDSNYHMAMEAGLKSLPIPKDQIFPMPSEDHLEENANIYEALIKKMLQGRAFDLIMLGMGDDGHTASLFPRTKGLEEEEKWVIANAVPQKQTHRMTMTFPCINAAHHIVFYVMGEKKAEMLSKILLQKDPLSCLPAGKIGTSKHKALWIADKDAAKIFLNTLC